MKDLPKMKKDEIEKVAFEIYQNRLSFDILGDARTDWEEAEKIVRHSQRRILFKANRELLKFRRSTIKAWKFLVWETPKWFIFSLPKLEWIKLLAVPLVLAAAGSIITSQIQQEANQNAALKEYLSQMERLIFEKDLLNASSESGVVIVARGLTVTALGELDMKKKEQLLSFLQASGLLRSKDAPKGNIVTPDFNHSQASEPIISFAFQSLKEADLQSMTLNYADFEGADLRAVNFRMADLSNANFDFADLSDADLREATLLDANFDSAVLENANLKKAKLQKSNLEYSFLQNANLQEASLFNAKLSGAWLIGANLKNANLGKADLSEANITQEELKSAKICLTQLPSHISLDPDRDCQKLGIDPKTEEFVD